MYCREATGIAISYGRAGQGRAGQGRAGQGRAGQGRELNSTSSRGISLKRSLKLSKRWGFRAPMGLERSRKLAGLSRSRIGLV